MTALVGANLGLAINAEQTKLATNIAAADKFILSAPELRNY